MPYDFTITCFCVFYRKSLKCLKNPNPYRHPLLSWAIHTCRVIQKVSYIMHWTCTLRQRGFNTFNLMCSNQFFATGTSRQYPNPPHITTKSDKSSPQNLGIPIKSYQLIALIHHQVWTAFKIALFRKLFRGVSYNNYMSISMGSTSGDIPLILRLVHDSTGIVNVAGNIVRKVLQSGKLDIVDKVKYVLWINRWKLNAKTPTNWL